MYCGRRNAVASTSKCPTRREKHNVKGFAKIPCCETIDNLVVQTIEHGYRSIGLLNAIFLHGDDTGRTEFEAITVQYFLTDAPDHAIKFDNPWEFRRDLAQ